MLNFLAIIFIPFFFFFFFLRIKFHSSFKQIHQFELSADCREYLHSQGDNETHFYFELIEVD